MIRTTEAAAIVGVSRRTIERWLNEGRLSWPLTIEGVQGVKPRKRGPRRNPNSIRYTVGRHRFNERTS
jgi:excisionase family DNA binding protein